MSLLLVTTVACEPAGAGAPTASRADAAARPTRPGAPASAIYNGPVAFAVQAEGLSATFVDQSTIDVESRQWVFGDGATSTAASPVHAYSREGTYDVTETVTSAGGQASVHTIPVRVMPLPPALQNGVPRAALSAVNGYELDFYARVPAGASRLAFALTAGSGDIEMFVRHGSMPTDPDYDCRRRQEGHVVICAFDRPTDGPYYARLRALNTFSSASLVATWDEKKTAHDAPPKEQ